MTKVALRGRLVDAQSNKGINGVEVEIWLKAPGVQERLGTDKTNENGCFRLKGDEARLLGLASEPLASLFFVVCRDDVSLCVERDVASAVEAYELIIPLEKTPRLGTGRGDDDDHDDDDGRDDEDGCDDDEVEYTVLGQVRGADARPLAGVMVRAFDRDLRGEEPLGEDRTSVCGFYKIRYKPEQFRSAEKRWADLVVRAFKKDNPAPLATSAILFNAPETAIVDLLAGGGVYRGPSEYERILRELTPVLAGVALVALTDEDLAFLSGETGRPLERMKQLRAASLLAVKTGLAPEAHYAFLRRNLPEAFQDLLQSEEAAFGRAIHEAVEENLVPARVRASLPDILARVKALRMQFGLDDKPAPNVEPPRTFVAMALPRPELQQRFMDLYMNHEGDIASFWQKARADPELARENRVDALQTTLKVGLLTQNHPPMVQYVVAGLAQGKLPGTDHPLRTLGDLAALDHASWVTLIQGQAAGVPIGVPPATPGVTPEERTQNYAAALAGTLEGAFPTEAVAQRIQRDQPQGASDLSSFLSTNPGFDIKASALPLYLAKTPGALNAVQDKEGTVRRLEGLQRLLRITGQYEASRALLEDGLDSARRISRIPERDFVASYAGALGGEYAAGRIYRRARQTAAAAVTLVSRYGLGGGGATPAAVPEGLQGDGDGLPDLRTLFGELSQCACKHGRSVLGPAAYFVDLLNLLKFRDSTLTGGEGERCSLLMLLGQRRWDLTQLELSCENADTPLPYIDLVNELLEEAVVLAHASGSVQAAGRGPPTFPARERQTRASAAELAAHPQYLDPAAYECLRTTRFPWRLPFDLWWQEVRAYFGYLGTRRELLMRTFQRTLTLEDGSSLQEPSPLDIATERLGLTPGERIILTDPDGTAEAWGMADVYLDLLGSVPTLLERSGLGLEALEELLALDFLKSWTEEPPRIVPEDPEEPCDLENLRVEGLTLELLSVLHRFVRLQRKLGWTAQELQRALALLQADDISEPLLQELAELLDLAAELGLPASGALDLIDGMNPRGEAALAQSLGLSEPELATLTALLETSPLATHKPGPLLEWIRRARLLLLASLSLAELTYLYRNQDPGRLAPGREQLAVVLGTLRQDLGRLAEELAASASPSRDELLRGLGRVSAPARAEEAVSFLESDPLDSPGNQALVRLYFPFLEAGAAQAALLSASPAPDEAARLARRQAATAFAMTGLLAHLRRTLGERAVKQRLGEAVGLEAAVADLLLGSVLRARGDATQPAVADFLALHGAGVSARYFDSATPDVPKVERLEAAIDFDWGSGAPDPSLLPGRFTAVFTGRLWAPVLDTYTFVVRTSGGLKLEVAGEVLIDALDKATPGELASRPITGGGEERPLDVKLTFRANGTVRSFLQLDWRTPSVPGAVVPRGAFFPQLDIRQVFHAYERLFKAALFVRAFRLSARELRHLAAHGSHFGGFDLNALPLQGEVPPAGLLASLERVQSLVSLRGRLPSGDRSLMDLFELAGTGASPAELAGRLSAHTGWSRSELEPLLGEDGFKLTAAHFGDERWLLRLEQALQLSARLGLGVASLQRWGRAAPDEAMAEEVRTTLQGRRGTDAWLEAEAPLRDRLREQQRDALVAYLVVRPELVPGASWRDANGLFQHFLIDVEMSACQPTSRVKQAINTVQLFIQRGLMNLEPGVSFSEVDARQWRDWMKSYRIWEANRKVFLYPENWIRSELRRDKSPFFQELEQQLVQTELTNESAEEALAGYVRGLNAVSRLQLAGTFHELDTANKVDILHVFARTDGTPREYYYRRRIDTSLWTPWERVELDIEGDHLIPAVAHRRLHLFWPVFTLKAQETALPAQGESGRKPDMFAEISMAWSTYQQGRWLPRRTAAVPLRSGPRLSTNAADYVFRPKFDAAGDIIIHCYTREVR